MPKSSKRSAKRSHDKLYAKPATRKSGRCQVGDKKAVYNGFATRTPGGLIKANLMKNDRGTIVSRKKHALGVKAYKENATIRNALKSHQHQKKPKAEKKYFVTRSSPHWNASKSSKVKAWGHAVHPDKRAIVNLMTKQERSAKRKSGIKVNVEDRLNSALGNFTFGW
jgi:hypothetical protein